jgi:hypothetical protein
VNRVVETVHTIAEQVLAGNPDPAVRLCLLRDVLHRAPADPDLAQARRELAHSHWVKELEREQWQDGSWGRLHSQDYSARQRIPTTEAGVERALALGMEADHRVLSRAAGYLERVLEGSSACRDRPEKNDRWPTGVRLFSAATLARIQPEHPALDEVWELWRTIARRTFAAGAYDPQAEVEAHRELTGASVKDSYLTMDNKYALALLGARADRLPAELKRALLGWVWHKPDGIRYLGEPVAHPPQRHKAGRLERWFASQELLGRFPRWRDLAGDAIAWLWEQRGQSGLWDLGPRAAHTVALPLSDSWRRRTARQFDWTARVLVLLRRCY